MDKFILTRSINQLDVNMENTGSIGDREIWPNRKYESGGSIDQQEV